MDSTEDEILFGNAGTSLISAAKPNPSSTDAAETNAQIKLTLSLLKEGEKEIQLSDQYKDVVLLLGNTGAGKSTFTQWFVQDSPKLTAKEVGDSTGEYTIDDDNTKIGDSTMMSKTIFPELVVDPKTNTAYYDCPGYSDTRSTRNDLTNTYFIKKVIDHVKRVKLIIVVSYPSLRKGVDRQDFMKLLHHVTDFVKDIDKYRNSIALVVTKVDNQYVKRGKDLVLVNDDKIIQTVGDFLLHTKQDLEENAIQSKNIPFKKQKLYENAIKFIDAILVQDNEENYTKIGIFRRPDEPGLLTNTVSLQQGRIHIASMIHKILDFTVKSNDDFGYTISEESKNDINDLVEEITEDVSFVCNNIAKDVKQHYDDLVEPINIKINEFINRTTLVLANESEAEQFLSKFCNDYDVISNWTKELDDCENIEHLAEKFRSSLNCTIINIPEDTIMNIETARKYFEFLKLVSYKELQIKPRVQLFQNTEILFHNSNNDLNKAIKNTRKEINQKVLSYIISTTRRVEDHYQKKIESLIIQELPEELRSGHNAIRNVENIIQAESNLQILSEILGETLTKMDITDYEIQTSLFNIFHTGKYLKFLQTLTNEEVSTWSPEWINPFRETTKYLYESEKWYQFLNDLYATFSEYEVQKNTRQYNFANIEDWGDSNGSEGIMITSSNFELFLHKIEDFHIKKYNIIKGLQLTKLQLQELNQILNITLKQNMITERPASDILVVKGDYIKFSDILGHDGKLLCDNTANITSVNIFAFHTVFIDTDLKAVGRKLQVTVIAPKWHILGSRKIDLDGAPGVARNPRKAKNGAINGENGGNGDPGLPGGSAGSFFGIGGEFIDGRNLEISANGGDGGPGQHGGDGAPGCPGKDATYASLFSALAKRLDPSSIEWRLGPGILVTYTEKSYTFQIKGGNPGKGGNGGNGGIGGRKGVKGNVYINELTQSHISISTKDGVKGEGGKGGLGGAGGKVNDLEATFLESRILFGIPLSQQCEKEIRSERQADSGEKGLDDSHSETSTQEADNISNSNHKNNQGKNLKGENSRSNKNLLVNFFKPWNANKKQTTIQEPNTSQEPTTIQEPNTIQEPVNIFNNYKNNLGENLNEENSRFRKYAFMKIIDQINSSDTVLSHYNTLALVQELRDLEELQQKFTKDNLIYFYESLLHRISEYAKAPKNGEISSEYKNVLSYLYIATLSKIYNLKFGLKTNLVIDTTKNLDMDTSNINTLRIINEYKANYKASIDKKIEEVTSLLKTKIIPEIDQISARIDNQICFLFDEVAALQDQIPGERQELIRRKQKLEKALVLKGFLRILNMVGHVASFFGPIGSTAASIIGAATSRTETEESGEQKMSHIPDSVISQIDVFYHRKAENLNMLLGNLSQEIVNYPAHLNDTSAKISGIREKCRTALGAGKLSYTQLEQLENELKTEITKKEEELKKQNDSTDQEVALAKKVIGKLKQTTQLAGIGFDVYNEYKSDRAILDMANDPITQAEINLQVIKEYEHQIYSSIIPTITAMRDSLKDTTDKSHASLDITKWKAQNILNGMKRQMCQFTNGSEVKDYILYFLKKLQDVMTTTINVYDRIQNYQELQNLANYIADLPSANTVSVSDPKLNDALNQLDVIIRSNLSLQ